MKNKFSLKIAAFAFSAVVMLSACSEQSVPNLPPVTDTEEVMVWIPTNGGTKYHDNSKCSNMKNPKLVSIEYAVFQGFEPCQKCY